MPFENEFSEEQINLLEQNDKLALTSLQSRQPVHVVYGGAHLFTSNTPSKLGRIAQVSIDKYASNFAEFGRAMWLKGADSLPRSAEALEELDFRIADNPGKARTEVPEAHFAWTVHRKTLDKLSSNPVEDYRIDFEDGYGFRSDSEEDSHAAKASSELAAFHKISDSEKLGDVRTGFRIKSFQPETRRRAVRTLELFLENLLSESAGQIPEGFVITLPKIKNPTETEVLSKYLSKFEQTAGLKSQTLRIEVLIETAESIPLMREIVEAADGRCDSAHFGAYDYTSALGISSIHQHIGHKACDFARNMMQISLSPLGIRLCDSVTTEMPIPINKGENLSIVKIAENRAAVHEAWRKHFANITKAYASGFYQGWDLHPSQLVARYAAVFAFFLEAAEDEAKRLRGFLDKATQAITTGNIFDDAASAEGLLNFFLKGEACGAFSRDEVCSMTGLAAVEFESASFQQIMKLRNQS